MKTIVCRNFPEWLSADDRELTVKHALTEAGLHIEDGPQPWELTTQKLVGDDGKQFLSAVSILTRCPTWLFGRRRCRPAIEFDLDMQSPAKSLPLRIRRRTPGKTGLQVPSQAKPRRSLSKATRTIHRSLLLLLGPFHSPHSWSQSL